MIIVPANKCNFMYLYYYSKKVSTKKESLHGFYGWGDSREFIRKHAVLGSKIYVDFMKLYLQEIKENMMTANRNRWESGI